MSRRCRDEKGKRIVRLIRKRGTRQSVVLFSIAALALAMTGVLYAHWTETLTVRGQVETGSVSAEWSAVGTNDDNIGGFGPADGGPSAVWSAGSPLSDGSVDPAGPDAYTIGGAENGFYEKDVAGCYVEALPGNMDLTVNATNTYPSYWCTVWGNLDISGTVPVKVGAVTLTASHPITPLGGNTFVIDPPAVPFPGSEPGAIQGEFFFGIFGEGDLPEFGCGAQYHPDDLLFLDGWFHIDQGAEQGATYGYALSIEFVNYNEWTPDMCTELFPAPAIP